MIVAFLPGFGRPAATLEPWRDLLPAEVMIFDLPGHGVEQRAQVLTMEGLADHYVDRIPRGALIVGESLGALIALAMAPRGYHVAAFEPPMSLAKQWLLQQNVRALAARHPEARWLPGFIHTFLGVTPVGGLEERNYWPLLDGLTAPARVIAASEPLWPMRTPPMPPSVVDDIDAYHLARHPMVRFRRIPGGHTLLNDSVEASRSVLLEVLGDLPG